MVDSVDRSRRLKIAMVIDVYDDTRNGAVISTKRFATLLSRQHDVIIISTGEECPNKVVLPSFYPPFAKNIMQRMKTVLAWPTKKKLLQAFANVDIVHVHFPLYLGFQAVKFANQLGVPVVTTFHVQAEHLLHNIGIRSQKAVDYLYRTFIKRLYNRSSAVICPSQFAEDELKRYGLTSPSVVISNGVLPEYQPMIVPRLAQYKNHFVILSVGRFAPEKCQATIIKAIANSKYKDRIQLILIGEGPREEQLRKLGAELPNPPVFLFLPNHELIHYYNSADLYVHAAEVEVECMTALEAIACGLTPLIANSRKSAAKQFALDERSLFVSNNPHNLARKIEYWIEHPNELAAASQQYVTSSRKYFIEESYKKLEATYWGCALKKEVSSACAETI